MLFSASKVSERISRMKQYQVEEWELSDDMWSSTYGNKVEIGSNNMADSVMFDESVIALQALGYRKKDADRYALDAFKSGATNPEEVIRYALKVAQQERTFSS